MIDNPVELLGDVLRQAIGSSLLDFHVAAFGRIESYNAAKHTATVQLMVKRPRTEEDNTRTMETVPPIPNVPVMVLGGGSFRATFPLSKGDFVLLVFLDQRSDRFLMQGQLVEPADDRAHHLSDAVAIPCVRDFAHPWTSSPTDAATIGHDTGAKIEITELVVRAGGNDRLVTKTEFDGHVHLPGTFSNAGGAVVGVSGAPTSPAVGTAVLRGFVVVGLALVLSLITCAYLLGKVT